LPHDYAFKSNPILGYSSLLEGKPYHIENETTLNQDVLFRGGWLSQARMFDNYFYRPLYAVLVSTFSPLLGLVTAGVLINYLAWAAAAAATMLLTRSIFEDDRAALLALLFVSLGMGWIVHVADYSAHALSFGLYFVGVYLTWRSRAWERAVPLRLHLGMGFYTALFTLTYPMGLAFGVAYIAATLRKNSLRDLGLFAVLAFTALPLWAATFRWIVTSYTGAVPPQNLLSAENKILAPSLEIWWNLLSQPLPFLEVLTLRFSEYLLFFESPLLVVLGLVAACVAIYARKLSLTFFVAFFFMPFCAALPFANVGGTARGYLVFGSSILLYTALAGCLAKWTRTNNQVARGMAWIFLVAVVMAHASWNTMYLFGVVAPLKYYVLGWQLAGISSFSVPSVMSLTGMEPTPIGFGGHANVVEAGAIVAKQLTPFTFTASVFIVRAFFFAYAIVMCIAMIRTRRVVLPLVAAGLVGWIVPVLCSYGKSVERQDVTLTRFGVPVPAESTLEYEVKLSREVREALSEAIASTPGSELEVFIPSAWGNTMDLAEIQVLFGTAMIGSNACTRSQQTMSCTADVLAPAIANADTLNVSLKSGPQAFALSGWQRSGLQGRTLRQSDSKILPSVELRLRDPQGWLLMAGF
jgi:hypothetical protein